MLPIAQKLLYKKHDTFNVIIETLIREENEKQRYRKRRNKPNNRRSCY
jgi:hypothetical protein